MERPESLALIDGNTVRRAAASRWLAAGGVHVEPFESITELLAHWPNAGLILAHDEGGALPAIVEHMGRSGGWLPVVGFAETPMPRQIVEAIFAGAVDYIAWPFDDAELVVTLVNARSRGEHLGSAKLREARARGRIERLTRREREVLACVAGGMSSRKIGAALGISSRTVEIHRANMLNKMNANHTSEAIRIAIEAGLTR